jgi:hypothetical protein
MDKVKSRIESNKRFKVEHPWHKHYGNAKSRCNPKGKYYGRVKFLMTLEEFRTLWFRDKAFLLNKPSIDRIDNNGDYVFDNCRFIELSENMKRPKIPRSKEVRKNISLSCLGLMWTKEHIENMSKVKKGIPWTKARWLAQENRRRNIYNGK